MNVEKNYDNFKRKGVVRNSGILVAGLGRWKVVCGGRGVNGFYLTAAVLTVALLSLVLFYDLYMGGGATIN